jgi:hypothetical protein
MKFIVHVPFSKDDASQLPHKFTVTNDDSSYSKTLTLASDAQPGDDDGTSMLTFEDLTDGHTYTLEVDDGDTTYKLFDSVAYADLQDIQVPPVDSSPSMPSLSDPDDADDPPDSNAPASGPASTPPASSPPPSSSPPASSPPPSSGAPASSPGTDEDTIPVSTDGGTGDDGSPPSSGPASSPPPDSDATPDDAPNSGQSAAQTDSPTQGGSGTANGWTDGGTGDVDDDDGSP